MRKTVLVRLAAGLIALGGAWVAYTQTPQGKQGKAAPKAANNKLNKLKDDLYEIEGDGGNVAFYVTNEGVIVIDDKFEYDYNDVVDKIKSVTSQPIKYVLNTHHHGDHTGSNANFLPNTEVISTSMARAQMVKGNQPGQPRVTFTDETQVFLGGKEVIAHYYGRGHTNGDAVIYFPALRMIHTGDLMAGNYPLIDYPGGGSLKEWTGTLDNVLKLDFDTVIPGHGAVTNKAGLQTYRGNVAKLQSRLTDLVRGGKNKDQVAETMKMEFAWGDINMRMSLDGVMVEMK